MAASKQGEKKASPGFWYSKTVRKLIDSRMSRYPDWSLTDEQEAWEVLRSDIVQNNSKGRLKGTPQRGFTWQLIDEIEVPLRDDGVSTYPRFIFGLFVFAGLLLKFHSSMRRKYGRNYLRRVEWAFRNDIEARMFFDQFQEIAESEPAVVVRALELAGRKGLQRHTSRGDRIGHRDRDCGVGPLVRLTERIEHVAAQQGERKRKRADVASHQVHPNSRPKVLVRILDDGKLELIFKQNHCPLSKLNSRFVSQLFFAKHTLKYRELWLQLYPRISYDSKDSGPPDRLKQVKKSVQDTLTRYLGAAPNGSLWIVTNKNSGYSLNRVAVNWVQAKDFDLTRSRAADIRIVQRAVPSDVTWHDPEITDK